MKAIVKNVTNSVIVLSVLAILLGLVLILYPGMSLVALGCAGAFFFVPRGKPCVGEDNGFSVLD